MEELGLLVSRVPRSLEMKSKLFGFELPDLLLIFMNLSLTNLIFGMTTFRYPLVWGSTLVLALFLHFSKKGKPDGYLKHLGEYLSQSGYKAAGKADTKFTPMRRESNDA